MDYKLATAIFWLFAAVALSSPAAALESTADVGDCLMPDQKTGVCISILKCPPLLSKLRRPLQLPDVALLRASQCGWEVWDKMPKVCCPDSQTISSREPPLVVSTTAEPSLFAGAGAGEQEPQPAAEYELDELLPKDCGRDLSNRIFGGSSLELDEYPWMTLLEYRTPAGIRTACGGTLISNRYVLTAAHCLRSLPSNWRLESVRIGEYNTSSERDCVLDGEDGQLLCVPAGWPQSVGVERQIVHEQYAPTPLSQQHDIALLRLARELVFDDYAKPICLPAGAQLKQRLVAAGWGLTEAGHASDVKLKVLVPVVEPAACAALYAQRIRLGDGQICAGGDKARDSCKGDSGGPLMQYDRDADGTTSWKIIGVVSFGPVPCGQSGQPGVYTNVHKYLPWIKSKLRP